MSLFKNIAFQAKNRIIIWSSSPTPRHLSREDHDLKRYMCSSVHCSTIYSSQEVEATYMSIDRGVDKEDVEHVHNGVLLSHEKERNNGICSNMDGPRNYHAEWSQSDNETPPSNALTDMWNLKKGHNEFLGRTDTDSQTLKNMVSKWGRLGGRGVVGCTKDLGWKCCKIWLW